MDPYWDSVPFSDLLTAGTIQPLDLSHSDLPILLGAPVRANPAEAADRGPIMPSISEAKRNELVWYDRWQISSIVIQFGIASCTACLHPMNTVNRIH